MIVAVMFTVLWLTLLTQPAAMERATIFPLEGNPTTALFGFEPHDHTDRSRSRCGGVVPRSARADRGLREGDL